MQEEKNGVKFPIDFDIAWPIAGYSRKDSATRYLPKSAQGEFYHVHVENSNVKAGRPVSKIYLSCDGLKHLCLMANTKTGRKTREYFIETEKKWSEIEENYPTLAEEIELKKLKLQSEIAKNQCEAAKSQERLLNKTQLIREIHGDKMLALMIGEVCIKVN